MRWPMLSVAGATAELSGVRLAAAGAPVVSLTGS